MARRDQRDHRFFRAAVFTGLLAAAGYYVYLSSQPACGPPGNTAAGQTFRYVPWALLTAQAIVVVGIGWVRCCRARTILLGVITATVLAAAAGIMIFLIWFGAGSCGE